MSESNSQLSAKLVFLTQIGIAMMTIIAYVALTITNHDGTPLITLLAGQGVGAAVQSRT